MQVKNWMNILGININKKRLKNYFYHLIGVLLFSYSFLIEMAVDIGYIKLEWEFYVGFLYVGGIIAYNQKMLLLKNGKKSIFYSFIVILLVFLIPYWFCFIHNDFEIKNIHKYFVASYLVVSMEIFDYFFYKEIIDEGKKEIVSRVIKLKIPKEYEGNALQNFFKILEIKHLYLFDDIEKKKNIDSFIKNEAGWIFYKKYEYAEFDYNIELNTYMEYTTLWTKLLQLSKEGFLIWIKDENCSSYDLIENGKVLLNTIDKER